MPLSQIGSELLFDVFSRRCENGAYEKVLKDAQDVAIREMTDEATALGANAVVGVDLDYEAIGERSSMLMVSASGTAVLAEILFGRATGL